MTFSAAAIVWRCATSSSLRSLRNSKTWQREAIVSGTSSGSVVAKTNRTCEGGSSSVFRSAFQAKSVSWWASSMM